MDIKAPVGRYAEVCRCDIDTDSVLKTVKYLQANNAPHEFRTTFCPELAADDVFEIWSSVVKNSDFYLQQYRQVEGEGLPHPKEYVSAAAERIRAAGGKCVVRGL